MSATGFAIAFTLVAGFAGSIQVAVSGALGKRIGVLEAAAFGGVVAALVLVAIALAVRGSAGVPGALREPPWLWIGGVMGAIVVSAITYSPQQLGTFATIALVIAGQLVMGVVIDALGLFGLEKIPLTWERVLGVALLAVGSVLILRR